MDRRSFLLGAGAAAVAPAEPTAPNAPVFQAKDPAWQRAYDRALAVLAGNVQVLPRFDAPVLIEGAEYPGVWQECAPQEALVYLPWRPDVAANNHRVFFALQHADGQLPANNKRSEAGFGQIQMVVPIAATAWEVARRTGDSALLDMAYSACGRWDDWLMRFRNTRGTGLIEGFCTYDTGHDNSPRWRGVANQCPGKDARRFVPGQGVPRLCPDLSATVFGGRVALAGMARALGKSSEADRWLAKAETLRQLLLARLYDPEDHAFYDLDTGDRFVKVRGDVLSRVCGEHVVDQALFDELWTTQMHNPAAFWPRFPLPSIALDDPGFVRPIPRNSWGGASQALTALRAGRWMEHYRRPAAFGFMMQQWCAALIEDGVFRQQMDPVSGVFTEGGSKGYSPAALVLLEYTWRLAGVRVLEDETVEWNVRPGCGAAGSFRTGPYELRYREGLAEIRIHGKAIEKATGTARFLTGAKGELIATAGIAETRQTVQWGRHRFTIQPEERIDHPRG